MKTFTGHVLAILIGAAIVPALASDEIPVMAPFAGQSANEIVDIRYDDLSYILKTTVFEAGRSDRKHAPPPKPGVGRRIIKGNISSTRLEGNRLYFPGIEGDNLKALHQIRRELEALPGAVPMVEWTKNQQLAYWLNLYNVTLIEELAKRYPVRELRRLLYGKKAGQGLLDKKLLKVAGIKLSLDDIHHRILVPKWQDPLVIYGLFHGYVGCANIRKEAYTAENVYRMLQENAEEFINSNRGARMDGDVLEVSELYAQNAALFPDDDTLKAHVAKYADRDHAMRFAAAAEVKATTSDYYIADLFQGVINDVNPNAANPGVFAQASGQAALFFDRTAPGIEKTKVPNLVFDYLGKIRERKAAREGEVSVEEYESPPETKDNQPE